MVANKKAEVELEKMNVAQKKDLLGSLLSLLMADIDPAEHQKLLQNVFLSGNESKPVIEMVEY